MTTYFYETKLDFANDICEEALYIANNHPEQLILRKPEWNYVSSDTDNSYTKSALGVEKAREIKKRKVKFMRHFRYDKPIIFEQYSLPEHLAVGLLKSLPKPLRDLGEKESIPILQISYGGNLLLPHCGHFRQASLFKLLQGTKEITKWYDETESFEFIPEMRIPDMDKIQLATETELKIGIWTIFNHRAWHSVLKPEPSDIKRINIGLDFNTKSADELKKIIESIE